MRVALLAEGGDRNTVVPVISIVPLVALLAEGGDRNKIDLQDTTGQTESPSSRRAGIEIAMQPRPAARRNVALLAEGGDRNY